MTLLNVVQICLTLYNLRSYAQILCLFNNLQLARSRTVSDKVNPSKSINVVFPALLYYIFLPGCTPFKGHIWHNRQRSITSAGILQFWTSWFADVIHQQKSYVHNCPIRGPLKICFNLDHVLCPDLHFTWHFNHLRHT